MHKNHIWAPLWVLYPIKIKAFLDMFIVSMKIQFTWKILHFLERVQVPIALHITFCFSPSPDAIFKNIFYIFYLLIQLQFSYMLEHLGKMEDIQKLDFPCVTSKARKYIYLIKNSFIILRKKFLGIKFFFQNSKIEQIQCWRKPCTEISWRQNIIWCGLVGNYWSQKQSFVFQSVSGRKGQSFDTKNS